MFDFTEPYAITDLRTNTTIKSGETWVSATSNNSDSEITQKVIDYYLTRKANRELYNKKQVRVRVYPLGVKKFVLPKKAM